MPVEDLQGNQTPLEKLKTLMNIPIRMETYDERYHDI